MTTGTALPLLHLLSVILLSLLLALLVSWLWQAILKLFSNDVVPGERETDRNGPA